VISSRRCRPLSSKRVLFWVATGISVVLMFVAKSIYGFFVVNNPLGEGVLVVEARIPDALSNGNGTPV